MRVFRDFPCESSEPSHMTRFLEVRALLALDSPLSSPLLLAAATSPSARCVLAFGPLRPHLLSAESSPSVR